MKDYMYKATGLIQETFDEKGIKYRVETAGKAEMVCAGFTIDEGPFVIARFVSRDNDNDVGLRVLGLINDVTEAKRARVMEACNVLNNMIRYVKFYIDDDGDVNVEYDFPCRLSDDCVGEVAYEMFRRLMAILDGEYSIFMRAMYTTEPLKISGGNRLHGLLGRLSGMLGGNNEDSSDTEGPADILRRLKELREKLAGATHDDENGEGDVNDEETETLVGEVDDEPHEIPSFEEFMRMMSDDDERSA